LIAKYAERQWFGRIAASTESVPGRRLRRAQDLKFAFGTRWMAIGHKRSACPEFVVKFFDALP